MLDELCHHVAQDGSYGIEPFVSSTNICEANIVEEDFLYNEDGHGLAEFRPGLHDPEAERNDLRGQEEIDHIGRVILHQSTDHAQGGKTEILKRARLGGSVQEGVQEKRDVS